MTVTGIRLPVTHSSDQLTAQIKKKSGLADPVYRIIKKSTDARHETVSYVYTAEAVERGEEFECSPRLEIPQVKMRRPVIVGSGPCGLMCAYILARAGASPLIIERGDCVSERKRRVDEFFSGAQLDPQSNIQFGEGGAGTFSDGKLTTRINDPLCAEVLEVFCECGAPEEIRYLSKPHLGTDKLMDIVSNLRRLIISLGGEFRFRDQLRALETEGNAVRAAIANDRYETDTVVLAIGHSARDTFEMLQKNNIRMSPKAFSVGVRIEHRQKLINAAQYGKFADVLPNADYNMSYHTKKRRGVYTFCMCPGGQVVAAASESGGVVTNGMSLYARDGENANSALLVGVSPADFGEGVLDGVKFQRELEQRAFRLGGENYSAPCQQLGDFMKYKASDSVGKIKATYRPGVTSCDLNTLLPGFVSEAMHEAIPVFGRRLAGFDGEALMTGVETRSSSPVRIERDSTMQSSLEGVYPAGEGAGYAGGIMSAAADGIRCALRIIEKHRENL